MTGVSMGAASPGPPDPHPRAAFFTRGLRASAYAFESSMARGGAAASNPMDLFWIALTLALFASVFALVAFCDRLLRRS